MATRYRCGSYSPAYGRSGLEHQYYGFGLFYSLLDHPCLTNLLRFLQVNLGWKLALVIKGLSPPSLLDTYEAERMPVVAEMLKIATLLNTAHHQDKALQEAFSRAQEQGLIAKDAKADEIWMRGWKLTQLDLNYRHSPVIFDERFDAEKSTIIDAYGAEGHSICAGDRAPEAAGLRVLTGLATQSQTTKLFDIFTPNAHTALVFPMADEKETQHFVDSVLRILKGSPSGLVRVVLIVPKSHPDTSGSILGVDIVVRDDEGFAYTNYGLGSDTATVVVIRPDAYIGGILKGSIGVQKYFSMVFNTSV